MSYYSQVAIGMGKEDAKAFEAALLEQFGDSCVYSEKQKKYYHSHTVFFWDWNTWSSSYENSEWLNEYFKKMEDDGKPYKYIRLGEDYEDIEETYSDDDDLNALLCVNRSIGW